MSEDFGSDFITIVDDDGQEFELEVLDEMQYNGETYVAFLPADMKEDDPDYGIIILRSVEDENGDELFEPAIVGEHQVSQAVVADVQRLKVPVVVEVVGGYIVVRQFTNNNLFGVAGRRSKTEDVQR